MMKVSPHTRDFSHELGDTINDKLIREMTEDVSPSKVTEEVFIVKRRD